MEKELQDIRILSLYKQHYFDTYNPEMDNQYSCLGYYDGISISKIPAEDIVSNLPGQLTYSSHLFKKKSQACLSRVWSGTVHNTSGLNGQYSKQNIGIFRCITSTERQSIEKVQEIEQNSPYFALALLQLSDRRDYCKTEQYLLGMLDLKESGHSAYACISVYHTYDNADLVALVYSNSLRKIGNILDDISNYEPIRYMNSVLGISEQYLSACFNNKCILPNWNNRSCFIDDPIPNITLKIATSETEKIIQNLKYQLEELFHIENPQLIRKDNITFSNGPGHGNLRVDINDVNVKSILALLIQNSVITHGNVLFGQTIYNIETSLYWSSKKFSAVSSEKPTSPSTQSDNPGKYFQNLTLKYRKKMETAWESGDEGLFSYYCALTQVCNTLAQYEGFSLAKDIFSLLYPSFQMFDEQLDSACTTADSQSLQGIKESIKDSICEFVNAVNSVVYHTVHTDQIFLMIPGYSGTTFSIPVKLCLMYSWIIRQVINLLNDANYKYACLLSPELETRPATTLINMGLFADDRLIRFSSSQRSLYMPRHFIILITHEIGHYVGNNIRNRQLRLECISKILAYLLAEGVFPEHYCFSEHTAVISLRQRLYLFMKKTIKSKIQEQCLPLIYKKIASSSDKRKNHATKMIPAFKEICYELLEERGIIHTCIYTIPDEFISEFSGENTEIVFDLLSEIQNQLDRNRRLLASSHVIINSCISELIQVFREVFSDVAALEILNYDMQTFAEVFNVSEGNTSALYPAPNKTSENDCRDIQCDVRIWIIQRLKEKKKDSASPDLPLTEDNSLLYKEWPFSLKDEFFSFCWVGKYLEEYASVCSADIRKQLDKHEKEFDEIQKIYNMFNTDDVPCNVIYKKMVSVIEDYNNSIAQEYSNNIGKK